MSERTTEPHGWRVWRRWTVATTLGEFAAFSVPGVAGALAWGLGFPAAGLFGVMVLAGTAEGAVLGSCGSLAAVGRGRAGVGQSTTAVCGAA